MFEKHLWKSDILSKDAGEMTLEDGKNFKVFLKRISSFVFLWRWTEYYRTCL